MGAQGGRNNIVMQSQLFWKNIYMTCSYIWLCNVTLGASDISEVGSY